MTWHSKACRIKLLLINIWTHMQHPICVYVRFAYASSKLTRNDNVRKVLFHTKTQSWFCVVQFKWFYQRCHHRCRLRCRALEIQPVIAFNELNTILEFPTNVGLNFSIEHEVGGGGDLVVLLLLCWSLLMNGMCCVVYVHSYRYLIITFIENGWSYWIIRIRCTMAMGLKLALVNWPNTCNFFNFGTVRSKENCEKCEMENEIKSIHI